MDTQYEIFGHLAKFLSDSTNIDILYVSEVLVILTNRLAIYLDPGVYIMHFDHPPTIFFRLIFSLAYNVYRFSGRGKAQATANFLVYSLVIL